MKSLFEDILIRSAYSLIRLLLSSCHKEELPHSGHPPVPYGTQPYIFYTWHQDLLPLLLYFRNSGIAPLISQSRDGERIARVASLFGTSPVRGSSSRGGAAAFRVLLRLLRNTPSTPVFITADGPKGPAFKVKEGTVHLARTAPAQVIPITWKGSSCWQVSSWDRFRIPKPFSRIHFLLGSPIDPHTLPDNHSEACTFLEDALNGLRQRQETGSLQVG